MIKAVFFDFYSTLATFDPPREELQARACLEFGIQVDPRALPCGYWVADDFMSKENARFPVRKRPGEEAQAFWADYEAILLAAAGLDVPKELALRIFTRVRQIDRRLVLFGDVLSTLDLLKRRGMVLGVVSNLSRPLDGYCDQLGLTEHIDFALTSSEVDAEKPHPQIFLAALKKAGVGAAETLHVGDQYSADVTGARNAGINPLLLDRDGFWAEIKDCPRIGALPEILPYLQ